MTSLKERLVAWSLATVLKDQLVSAQGGGGQGLRRGTWGEGPPNVEVGGAGP